MLFTTTTLKMKAIYSFGTSVPSNRIHCVITVQNHCCENLKSYKKSVRKMQNKWKNNIKKDLEINKV
jgi:hypothetical protein